MYFPPSFRRCLPSQTQKFQVSSSRRGISSSALIIEKQTDDTRYDNRPSPENLTFGTTMSDHMLTISFSDNHWSAPKIEPYQNLSLSPAATSLHYGLQCFEGMKAYSSASGDGGVRLFRPDKNMERLQNSMERLDMPGLTKNFDTELIECIKELVRIDRRWIPCEDGYSLYIRPTVIATHPYLGLAAPTELLLYVITCPVGPYYPTGFKPVSLYAIENYARAWPGGTGNNKIGGNYAPTMKPQQEAIDRGYSQVLWLYGDNHEITEVGSMNVFFVIKDDKTGRETLVTPPLDRGDILPGVTRDSILALARAREDLAVEERFPTMGELRSANAQNRLVEAFGAGTAAVVTPISKIHFQGSDLDIHATGKWTNQFWNDLTDIQYARKELMEGWSVKV